MASEFNTASFAARDSSGHLSPYNFNRRTVGAKDVKVKIAYCGICHTDLHQILNESNRSIYPMVPGHEIVGIVSEVGEAAQNAGFLIGDRVGVGFLVNSCRTCHECKEGEEQYCRQKAEYTINSRSKSDGSINQGGFSDNIVVNYEFVVRIPDNLPLDRAAPLLCAGITVYSPLKFFVNKPKANIGILGMGGLGHIAIMIAAAMGHNVSVISSSPSKRDEALSFGATDFIVSTNPSEIQTRERTLDLIIDTVSANHVLTDYFPLLKSNSFLVLLGVPPQNHVLPPQALIGKRISVGGSLIGGIHETQEMLNFCGQHNVLPLIELISIEKVNEAMERLHRNDVRYRFVIDVENTLKP
jgi:D-arabinose 1-dehydrogenase-like Zn-dependent alcohol dehydrogenase